MFIYEVTAAVRVDLVEKFEKYMREQHISDVLATNCFRAASFARAASNRYQIRYEASDKETLDRYLETHTATLRADFQTHFPEGIELSREVWEVLESWKK